MSEQNTNNIREDDKKPQGVLSGVGSNPTPGAKSNSFCLHSKALARSFCMNHNSDIS
jgi:hypothetical protein